MEVGTFEKCRDMIEILVLITPINACDFIGCSTLLEPAISLVVPHFWSLRFHWLFHTSGACDFIGCSTLLELAQEFRLVTPDP